MGAYFCTGVRLHPPVKIKLPSEPYPILLLLSPWGQGFVLSVVG